MIYLDKNKYTAKSISDHNFAVQAYANEKFPGMTKMALVRRGRVNVELIWKNDLISNFDLIKNLSC